VGGSRVKVLASGQAEPRQFPSGKQLTPDRLVEGVLELTKDWDYEAVSLGCPGRIGEKGPTAEPANLGKGWVSFDFADAFGRPVKVLNDAAMQALGSYEGGRMLFLGLGTSLGSALVGEHMIVPLALGQLPYDGEELGAVLGKKGLKRRGQRKWERALDDAVGLLRRAMLADYVVLGGANAKRVRRVPEGVRLGGNRNAFEGGFRLWETAVAPSTASHLSEVWKVMA
jgi:polyphosphate glucokinase